MGRDDARENSHVIELGSGNDESLSCANRFQMQAAGIFDTTTNI